MNMLNKIRHSPALLAACFATAQFIYAQQPAQLPQETSDQTANTAMAQQNSAKTSASQADDRYRIGPGDVLDIRIFNRPNLSREAVRVEGNGMIRMPLIENEIQAACRTEGELGKAIAQGYLK